MALEEEAVTIPLKTTTANGIHMRYADVGNGPLVLFCHGWPESWYSWRHQLTAVSAAGFRCVAPDMRGYGGTEAPESADQYTLMHLVGDMAELVKALGETQAIIVGHDWGAPVAWHAALWRPDLFPAVCAMSVPYAPPGYVDILTALPEAVLQRDIKGALRRLYFTASGDLDDDTKSFGRLPGGTLLGNTADPATLPAWLGEADLDYYTQEFARAGFRGGLNWYRNLRRNWELGGPWRGQPIRQPSLFIAGKKDGVLRFPAAQAQLEAYPKTLPGLRGCHLIEGAGHWVQQEKAGEVNQLLIEFLRGL